MARRSARTALRIGACFVVSVLCTAGFPRAAYSIELSARDHATAVRIAAVPGLTPELDPLYQEVLDLLLDGEKEEASLAAEALLTGFRQEYGSDSTLLATPSLYLGLLQLDIGETYSALSHLDRAAKLIERQYGRFDQRLIPPLRGLAIAHIETGRSSSATAALRRAQHLTHRHMGVYNTDQLPILDMLLTVGGPSSRGEMVDTLSSFNLKVHEEAFGKDDPRIVPALMRMAEHLANKGARKRPRSYFVLLGGSADFVAQSHAFRESLRHSERALEILEQHYGKDDPKIIEVLRMIAETKLKRGLGKGDAVAAIQRAHDIVAANAGSDVSDVAYAKVELADLYTLWDDHRAAKAYRDAWEAIPESEQYDALRYELFGEPKQLSTDRFELALRERPWRKGRINYLELGYVVRADGRARRFTTIDGNVPSQIKERLRGRLGQARFRPRVVDGEVVETADLTIRREFNLY